MNVAKRDLCKELYELSGWIDNSHTFFEALDNVWEAAQRDDDDDAIPAYDLGYLLRKLPLRLGTVSLELHVLKTADTWEVGYNGKGVWFRDSSPEDAACSLAIELIKQGIVQPPNNNLPKQEIK